MKANILLAALRIMLPYQKSPQNFRSPSAIRKPPKDWSGVFNGKRECTRRQKQMAAKAVL